MRSIRSCSISSSAQDLYLYWTTRRRITCRLGYLRTHMEFSWLFFWHNFLHKFFLGTVMTKFFRSSMKSLANPESVAFQIASSPYRSLWGIWEATDSGFVSDLIEDRKNLVLTKKHWVQNSVWTVGDCEWRVAAEGLKTLRLPRAQMVVWNLATRKWLGT